MRFENALATIRKGFRVEEDRSKAFDAFAERHGLNQTEAFSFLVDAIPLVETAMQTPTDQVEPKTGATAASLLSPTEEKNRDSPSQVLAAAPDPLPLEANSSTKQTASTIMSKTSDNGLSVGETSKTDMSQWSKQTLERWQYQQAKASLALKTEQGKQAIREQVRRFRNVESNRRASVDYDVDTKGPVKVRHVKEADCGRPDFYD